jgi:ABC-type sulfate/molybdate transport systems ATPase subunit
MSVIQVDGLTKRYDGKTVVDDVSFSAEEGEIFAILGPNGAGKTTTVESIAGLRTPDSGRIEVFDFDPLAERAEDAVTNFLLLLDGPCTDLSAYTRKQVRGSDSVCPTVVDLVETDDGSGQKPTPLFR